MEIMIKVSPEEEKQILLALKEKLPMAKINLQNQEIRLKCEKPLKGPAVIRSIVNEIVGPANSLWTI